MREMLIQANVKSFYARGSTIRKKINFFRLHVFHSQIHLEILHRIDGWMWKRENGSTSMQSRRRFTLLIKLLWNPSERINYSNRRRARGKLSSVSIRGALHDLIEPFSSFLSIFRCHLTCKEIFWCWVMQHHDVRFEHIRRMTHSIFLNYTFESLDPPMHRFHFTSHDSHKLCRLISKSHYKHINCTHKEKERKAKHVQPTKKKIRFKNQFHYEPNPNCIPHKKGF